MKLTGIKYVLVLFVLIITGSGISGMDKDVEPKPGDTIGGDSKQPNVIIILADDLGCGDMSLYDGWIETPHIDQMAREGVKFTDFHSNSSVCSPSRAAFITGRYQQRVGIVDVIVGFRDKEGLEPSEITISGLLKEAGYKTGIFGKWHCGTDIRHNPTRHGFDEFIGFLNGGSNYLQHKNWLDGTEIKDQKGYGTHIITDKSVDFIKRNKDNPFFLYVSHQAVHNYYQIPSDPPETRGRDIPLQGEEAQRRYKIMLQDLDNGVGQILDAVKENDLEDNTFVFFFSDNGDVRMNPNERPYRGGKFSNYEGGHRVPAVARWPGHIKAGSTSNELIVGMDLLPTVMDIVGIDIPESRVLDGISIKDHLLNQADLSDREVFFGYEPKLGTAMRDGYWKMQTKGDIIELYDLSKDIKETTNIADKYPERTEKMKSAIEKWKLEVMPRTLSLTAQEVTEVQLLGNRFFTFNTVVRVNQIETSRDVTNGEDESSIHSPKEARIFRETIEKSWPGARITWAFSWLALKDERPNYQDLKKLIVSYHEKFGDEITFIPGGYFANMYNTREQVNRDLHDGLQMVSLMVGGGYRPLSVIAGYLAADNLKYLAEEEGIHVCQGNIWSQYAIDNGDGDGSISYPYYPSREHFLKPAQAKDDFIDCVNLDGWTMDFLSARFPGGRSIDGEWCGSRQGVGPIETVIRLGTERGTKEMLAVTAAHFDKGFELNDFAWVTCTWELGLVEARKIYGYKGRNGMEGMEIWFKEMRRRWPDAQCITLGEFGMLWREQFKNNDEVDYRLVQRGSGVCGSEPELEIQWFMNKDFRLAILRDWQENAPGKLIDFTRYDLKAEEPADPEPGQHSRNWSLMNRLNQKGIRPQDKPIDISLLNEEEKALIRKWYPELLKE